MQPNESEGVRIAPIVEEKDSRARPKTDGARTRKESLARAEDGFLQVLERDGLHGALGFLNRRVRYRFTGDL